LSFEPRPLKWPPIFPVEKGLVLWLPFDDRSGSKAYDRSGKGNHGTLYGPTWVAGPRGSALSFDGSNDYVEVADSPSLRPDAFTVMLWLNVISWNRNWAQYLSKEEVGGSHASFRIQRRSNTAQIRFQSFNGVSDRSLNSTTLLNLGTWYHLCMTYSAVGLRGYVNGALESATVPYTLSPYGAYPVYLGRDTAGGYGNAIIREARIYSRALTAQEIKRHYESELLIVRH